MCGMIAELKILATTILESKHHLMITLTKPLTLNKNELLLSQKCLLPLAKCEGRLFPENEGAVALGV